MTGVMSETESLHILSDPHRAAILELGSRGSGGEFEPAIMSSLFTLGFVEIRSRDRRLVLTECGRQAYAEFSMNLPMADL
jgi:hypothetical protein